MKKPAKETAGKRETPARAAQKEKAPQKERPPKREKAPKKERAPQRGKADKADKKEAAGRQETAVRKKPGITLICALVAAALVAGLCLAALLTEQTRRRAQAAAEQGGTVVLTEREPETLQIEPTPEPTPVRYPVPEGAVELVCDRTPVLALASRAEAEALLTDYLEKSRIETETERTLRATFDCELLLLDATGELPVLTQEDALEKLLETPSLVPVLLETERRELQSDDGIEVVTRQDAALAVGTRVVSQVGAAAYVATTTQLTYRAGEVVTGSDPVSETLIEARATIVRTGTYESENPREEPGSEEGEPGRAADGLDFTAPIKGTRISSYFGTREGSMHWGVDYEARAGTEILAPEEGVVVYCGERGTYGFVIDIDHGNGFVSRLTHCDGVQVELHQRVFRGEAVATLAALDDGTNNRPHLHYELLIDGVPHNPVPYL